MASARFKTAYHWYRDMDDETRYSWWAAASLILGSTFNALVYAYYFVIFPIGGSLCPGKDQCIPTYLGFCFFFLGIVGPLILTLLAFEHGNESKGLQNFYNLGFLPKSLAEVGALSIAVALRYTLEHIFFSLAWIAFFMQLQYLWQLLYFSRDFIFSDIVLGISMQILIINQKTNDHYSFAVMYLLCVLVIYQKNWSPPTCTTIFSKSEYIAEDLGDPDVPKAEGDLQINKEIP